MRRNSIIALLTITLIFLATAGPSPLAAADSPRNIVVFFDLHESTDGLTDAVEFIFNKLVGPSDQLIIRSPAGLYGFSRAKLAQPKAELIALVRDKLRSDIIKTAQSYKQVINELELAVRNLEGLVLPSDVPQGGMNDLPETRDLSELFNFYRQALLNLTQLRKVNDASLRQLADAFRGQKGENHIIVLFEREFRPVPRREALNILADMPKFAFQANEMFLTGGNKEPFNANALAEYFKQMTLTQHFIYLTAKKTSATGNLLENSGDIYSAFSKIAGATGGSCLTTAEPVDGLKAVLKAWKEAK
jgi:hypothetical protein